MTQPNSKKGSLKKVKAKIEEILAPIWGPKLPKLKYSDSPSPSTEPFESFWKDPAFRFLDGILIGDSNPPSLYADRLPSLSNFVVEFGPLATKCDFVVAPRSLDLVKFAFPAPPQTPDLVAFDGIKSDDAPGEDPAFFESLADSDREKFFGYVNELSSAVGVTEGLRTSILLSVSQEPTHDPWQRFIAYVEKLLQVYNAPEEYPAEEEAANHLGSRSSCLSKKSRKIIPQLASAPPPFAQV